MNRRSADQPVSYSLDEDAAGIALQPAPSGERLANVEILRGLAALAVTWFHMTSTHAENVVRLSGSYGWLGVEMFFVISGMVIPMSIHKRYGAFRPRHFAPYMLRRLVRLEPPYLVSIGMVIVLWEISARAPGFAGEAPDYTLPQILAHLAYLIPLTQFDWLQVVYWTLAYEFVFYLLAAVFFWILGNRQSLPWLLGATLTILLALAGYLPPISLLFLTGIAIFRRMALRENVWVVMAALVVIAAAMVQLGREIEAVVGLMTGLVIWATAHVSFSGPQWRPLFVLGAISYSLYLVHVPIGGRFVNLFQRFLPETVWVDLALSLGGLGMSLCAAWLFWRWIERPAIELARRSAESLERKRV